MHGVLVGRRIQSRSAPGARAGLGRGRRLQAARCDVRPPRHEPLPDAIADLVTFMRRDDLPPLVQATIARASSDHPPVPRRGTVEPPGRSSTRCSAKQLTANRNGAGLHWTAHRADAYFNSLTAYRGRRATTIVELIASVVPGVENGRTLASDLAAIRKDRTSASTVRRGAAAHRLADLLVRRPVVNSPIVPQELGRRGDQRRRRRRAPRRERDPHQGLEQLPRPKSPPPTCRYARQFAVRAVGDHASLTVRRIAAGEATSSDGRRVP